MTNHQSSPGLWALAWRRLRADRVAMAALAVVALFLAMLALSSAGLVAGDWEKEVGVNYAPPSFIGAQASFLAGAEGSVAVPPPPNEFDPLAADIAQLRARAGAALAPEPRRETLPFGADKWGHDVIKKTIKGGETSIVVGLVAALLAVSLGT
ncbi:MAG: ABC transporter permease, partial [Telluria sp.]